MTFDPGTPPAAAATDDHVLAAWLATVAGERLLEVRAEGLEGRELKDAGDREAHELLMEPLRRAPPRRRRALRGGQGRPGPPRVPAACGSSTRSTAPASSARAARRLGGARRPLRSTAPSPPVRSRCPALGETFDTGRRRSCPPRASSVRPDRGLPQPSAGVRRRRRRGARRRAGADGLGRGEGDVGRPRRDRRLRARRRPVRVGLRRAGRGRRAPPACSPAASTARRSPTTRRTSTSPTSSSAAPSSPSGSWSSSSGTAPTERWA